METPDETNLTNNDRQHDYSHDDGEDQQQTTALVAGCLLVPRCLPVFDVGLPSIGVNVFHVVGNVIQLLPLLVDNLCDLSEQHVEIANTLLNIANLFLALDDERLLEVHLVLAR